MISLAEKVIVITGGKGLLGNVFVDYLRSAQAKVIIADINANPDLADEYICDITKTESVTAVINAIVQQYGRIDGWVNNAYPRTSDWGKFDFEEESMESWKSNIDMHLVGYTICCQLALNQMKQQNFGSLINIGSIYGVNGPDFTVYEDTPIKNPSAYAAIKGALTNLSRYLAAYYGPYNVRVNTVSPGGIFDNQNPVFVSNYEKKTPLKRMGLPKDIAPSIAFLLSDEAAYITGHNLIIDGVWTIV
jgi:NAD(P)-dependent dehydrogenase (short-subunit alcohol dehydrogenase family)